MSKRFKLNQPILTIGISVKEGPVFKPYPSLSSALIHCALNQMSINNIHFILREIIPVEKHINSNPGNELYTAVGYIGISPTPVLPGIDFKFSNQYPHPNYSLPPRQDDYIWTVFGDPNTDWCKLVVNAKVPYRYEVLQHALVDIANIESARTLIIRIFDAVKQHWPNYEIEKKEYLNSGIYFFKVNRVAC